MSIEVLQHMVLSKDKVETYDFEYESIVLESGDDLSELERSDEVTH